MSTNDNSPQIGYLAGPADLEQIMNLQDWLNATDALRHDHGWDDAWADGSTDDAFAFNSWIGVQKSHASNVWVNGWDGEEDVSAPNLDKTGHGLYVYMPRQPAILAYLDKPQTTYSTFANEEFENTSGDTATRKVEFKEESGEELSISNTTTIGFKATGSFEMEGFKFEVETSLDSSNTQAKTQSTINTTTQDVDLVIPANKTKVFTWVVYTTTQTIRYGLDVVLGEASPDGSIAKATTRGHRGQWDQYLKLSDVLAKAGKTGLEKQTIEFNVAKTTKLTKIFIGEKQGDGQVSWGKDGPPPA